MSAGIDVERFVEDGFVVVRRAVPAEVAAAVLAELHALAPSSGSAPWRIDLHTEDRLPALADVITPQLRAAFDALAGDGRWEVATTWGFPWRLAGPLPPLWHIDGDWFTHHVSSWEQVLTPIFLWHDVGESDGPTLLAPGSHRDVARMLAAHEPGGLAGDRVAAAVHAAVRPSVVVPATGRAGDVVICHPFLAHTVNPNGASRPRVIANVCVHGRAALDLDHPTSPVERAIAAAVRPQTAVTSDGAEPGGS